jgi:hypothetical protein
VVSHSHSLVRVVASFTRIAAQSLAVAVAVLGTPRVAWTQTDEIQVYDGNLTAPGKFNLTLHNNFTPDGLRTPAFPGALISDKSLNGVPEWAYGVTDWFEAGLYLPLYSIGTSGAGRSVTVDGVKLRLLFAVPHADVQTFFYGVNFEFSFNARHWDPARFTSEVRPIIGLHLHPFDVIVNPILDSAYDGVGNLEFAPATRIAYNLSPVWAVAAEEYAGFGPLHRFYARREQSHQLFVVLDRNSKFLNVEAGIGFGLTNASDRLTLKLILSRDLN